MAFFICRIHITGCHHGTFINRTWFLWTWVTCKTWVL